MVIGKTDTTLLSRFDKDYHVGLANRSRLFLTITDSSLFSTVYDPVAGNIVGVEEFALPAGSSDTQVADQIRLGIEQSQAGEKFDSVHVCLNHHHCTLVPDAVFEPDRCRDYLSLNFSSEFSGVCMSDQINQTDIHSIFNYSTEVLTLLQQFFHTITFSHAANIIVESVLRDYKTKSGPVIFVHPSGENMSITVVENGQLKLLNYYEYRSPEDLAYYVMFVVEQLQLNANSVEVYLAGEIDRHAAGYSILNTYLKNLDFYGSWNNQELPVFNQDLDLHRYFLSFNQVRCA